MQADAPTFRETRPISVAVFEALSILSVLVPVLIFRDGSPFGAIAELLVAVALTLWVTRGRSKIGRLVYTGLWVFTVLAVMLSLQWGYVPQDAPVFPLIVFAVGCGLLLALLWWPSTSAWLARNESLMFS